MFISKKTIARHAVTVGLLSSIVFGSVPAFADDSQDSGVTQQVNAGALTASLSGPLVFNQAVSGTGPALPLTTSHAPQPVESGVVTLSAEDLTGDHLGWTVSMVSTALVPDLDTPDDVTYTIPANQVSIKTLGAIQEAGVATLDGGMSKSSFVNGTHLGTGRAIMDATADSGINGVYTETVVFEIVFPANVHAGAYTGTITTTNVQKV